MRVATLKLVPVQGAKSDVVGVAVRGICPYTAEGDRMVVLSWSRRGMGSRKRGVGKCGFGFERCY